MPFDISTAKTLGSGGFDIKSAKPDTSAQGQHDTPATLASIGAGVGTEFGKIVLGGQGLVGKGLQMLGEAVTPDQQSISGLVRGKKDRGLIQSAGDWLVNDAETGKNKLTGELAPYKEAHPFAAGAGQVGTDMLVTLPVGGVLAGGLRAAAPALVRAGASAPTVNMLANAMASSGMTTGGTGSGLTNMLLRTVGGAATGGASAALINPDEAGAGAAIGAALPGAGKLVGAGVQAGGNKLLSLIRGSAATPEVAALARRAGELGIDVPADRIANSKPLNALAASLNYIPFSGRAGTERRMQDQLNQALSRTFGQDSDNVTSALRAARGQLGSEFDRVLQGNQVQVDTPFLDALTEAGRRADSELPSDGARVIRNQIEEIMSKGASGAIDGQAAYNIKRRLDRIGSQNTPQAYYASDLRRDLMDALNRSMTPEEAAAFAVTRKQYGNMLSLEKLAQNGAEGDVSIARVANMKNIGNDDLQELADIAAQFLKAREGQHGAMQRVSLGLTGAALHGVPGVVPGIVAGAAAGRATNAALNSNALKSLIMGQPVTARNRLLELITSPEVQQLGYRAAPVVGTERGQ